MLREQAADTPTRVFVDVVAKGFTVATREALFYYIPTAYRGEPGCFVSHSWDGSLYHLLRAVEQANATAKGSEVMDAAPLAAADACASP